MIQLYGSAYCTMRVRIDHRHGLHTSREALAQSTTTDGKQSTSLGSFDAEDSHASSKAKATEMPLCLWGKHAYT
ncbi:MAG: hypothetical protein OXN15_08400, partial [Chloroflexota bacterium]|nr:hypothetical protein [Chloroflexota bacterium]